MKQQAIYTYWKLAVLFLLLFSISSCKKFLDLKPVSTLTTGNSYNSAQDIENALTGAYSTFYEEYYIWDNVLLSDVRSDNAYVGGGGDPGIVPYDVINIAPGNDRMYADWSQLYQGIARCNILLSKINDIEDAAFASKRKAEIIGEVSFLRAFHYFQLVKTFGGVPIELESSSADPAVTRKPRATETQVYDQIVADLTTAANDLPDNFDGSDPIISNVPGVNKSRATRGAANALLAKVWAQRPDRDYEKVLNYCNLVLQSNAGYELVPNYADLFDGNHYFNAESILEIPFIAATPLGNWGPQMFLAPEDGWQKYCVPSKDLINTYRTEGDSVRLHANVVFWNNIPWADENWNPCQDDNTLVPFNYKQKHPSDWASGDHYYLLRLADIVLLKAEAQNEKGDAAGALQSLNLVRARVDLPAAPESSADQLRKLILKERRLELAFEAQRWDDLVRQNVCTAVMNSLQEDKFTCSTNTPSDPIHIAYNMSDEKKLCPIPQLEIDANPNLTQNPGY